MDQVNLDKFLNLSPHYVARNIILQSIEIGVPVSKTVVMAYSQKKKDPTIQEY